MSEPTPPDIEDTDELVSAVFDGEATAAETARVESDPALRAELEKLAAMADVVGTAAPPPAGLADEAIATALTHLPPVAGAPPIAPPVDELSARRAAGARRFGPILAAAAAVVLLALGTVAVRNLDSDSQDTASAGLDTESPSADGAAADEFVEFDEEADAALESADAPSEPTAADGNDSAAGASDFVDAADLDEFEVAVRAELDDLPPTTTIESTLAPEPSTEQADSRCDTIGNSSRELGGGVVRFGRAELDDEPVTYEVFDTPTGLVLVISDAACGIIAEIDL